MGRIGISEGVFFNGIAAILAGAGSVRAVTATDTIALALGWAGIVLGVGLFIWGITFDGDYWWKKLTKTPPAISPINVADELFVDLDYVKNDEGTVAEGCYSAAVCLWVTNGLETGAVLRNLQARYYHISGEHVLLPIRASERGVVDLRHGEVAVIEIGRMLWRLVDGDNALPGMPRTGMQYQVANQAEIDSNCAPVSTHRSFKISNALGKSQGGIGQLDDEHRFGAMQIIISADDVVSRYVRMQTNLYAKESRKWLKFLPEDWTESD